MKRFVYTFFAFVMMIAFALEATAQQSAVDEASAAMRRFVQGRADADAAALARLLSLEQSRLLFSQSRFVF